MASRCRLRPRSLVAGSEPPAHWLEPLEEKDGSREAETSDWDRVRAWHKPRWAKRRAKRKGG
jgi:hypothetical protein